MNNKYKNVFCVCEFDTKRVKEAIARMPKKEKDVINTFYRLEKPGKRSVHELAAEYKCNTDEIYKIKDNLIVKLRGQLKSTCMHKDIAKCDMCLNGNWLSKNDRGEGQLMRDLLSPKADSRPF